MKPPVFIAASFAALSGMLFLGTGVAQATTIPPTISTTLTITTDSQLNGNVACTVTTSVPCIKFGANGIKLKLNGFIITGNGGRNTCAITFEETGIDTNLKNNVFIQGPGLVRRFNGIGIVVSGDHSSVEGVAITSICIHGIQVAGSHNEVEGNSVSRASLSGAFFAGIFLSPPGGHNRVLHNEFVGAGPIPPPGVLNAPQSGFGISVGSSAPSNNNLIQDNNASGNPAGGIFISPGSTGNIVRRNQALGDFLFGDIFDTNALPANTYDNNLCELSQIGIGPSPPPQNICKLPNIAGHRNGPVDRD